MPRTTANEPLLLLGIDGGGTKCKVRLEDHHGSLLAQATAGPANIATSIAQAQQSIVEAASRALTNAGLPLNHISSVYAYAGLAGANIHSAAYAMRNWQYPFAQLSVTTDLHIACAGAHVGSKGAVIIVGTGFCAGAVDGTDHFEIGGHGLMLSDGASGAWLGLELVRHTLEVLDGLAAPSAVTDALLSFTKCDNAEQLTALCLNAKPVFFAQFAPLVFSHCNTSIASQLIASAKRHVSRYITHLQGLGYTRISLLGGVADALFPMLDEPVQRALISKCAPPEQGAIALLRKQL